MFKYKLKILITKKLSFLPFSCPTLCCVKVTPLDVSKTEQDFFTLFRLFSTITYFYSKVEDRFDRVF